jgi:hypothetical protein
VVLGGLILITASYISTAEGGIVGLSALVHRKSYVGVAGLDVADVDVVEGLNSCCASSSQTTSDGANSPRSS